MKNILRNFALKGLTILLVTVAANSYGQYAIDWEQCYGGSNNEIENEVIHTSDGGYLVAGTAGSSDGDVSTNFGLGDIWVVKTDAQGNLVWEQNYGGTDEERATTVAQTADGGYIIGGHSKSIDEDVSGNNGDKDYWIVRTDSVGNILWENNYGGTNEEELNDIIETSDGNFILVGKSFSSDGDVGGNYGAFDYWVLKVDANGGIVWEQNYGGSDFEIPYSVIESSDGAYVIAGYSKSLDGDVNALAGDGEWWVLKIDTAGAIVWSQVFTNLFSERAYDIIETSDLGFAITGYTNDLNNGFQYWVIKTDALGNLVWDQKYGGSGSEIASSIVETANGNFIVAGYSDSNDGDVVGNYGSWDYWILQIDNVGNILWNQNYGGTKSENATSMAITADGNCVISGSSQSNDIDVSDGNPSGFAEYWTVKLRFAPGDIYGNVYFDYNNNCIFESGDLTNAGILEVANELNTNNSYFSNTNNTGAFHIDVDTTDYNVYLPNFSPFWEINNCSQDSQLVNLSGTNLTDTVDFFLSPTVLCPFLEVDISTPLLRRCFSNTYVVAYCNNGSQIANGAYVEVELDSTIVIDSTSIPFTSVAGNLYTFPLGDIDVFECGSFKIWVSVPCDSTTFLGQVLCAEASIFPNSLCLPSTSTWNGAELEASANCLGEDSIEFILKNIGSGNMNSDVPIIGIEDVILVMDTDQILNAGEFVKWIFPTNGTATHRIIAQQPSDHPFKTYTTDAIANCDVAISAGPPPFENTSFLAYPNDEEAPFEAVDCQSLIGSYDPNDKTVFPSGVSSSHFITETTDLEYKIRFQNTGTDTAFTVYITDSISSLLDLTTIKPGASSHPYQFDVYGTGVVKFTFNNILLPDSFIDEPGSNGFVQYKIAQNPGNQTGDVINNNADIFFDFNLPVRTNTAFNEIGGIVLDTIIYQFPTSDTASGINDFINETINVYPNPSSDIMYFEFENSIDDLTIELYDFSGKLQQQTTGINTNSIQISRGGLTNGMYLFKIYSGGEEIAKGKLTFY